VVIPNRIFNKLSRSSFTNVKEKASAKRTQYYWRPTPGQKRAKCSLHKISAKQLPGMNGKQ